MAKVFVNAPYEHLVRKHSLHDFDRMMRWHGGQNMGRHASRDVERIEIEENGVPIRLFLKREWQTYFKDRVKNWLSGLGWSTKARREWHVLRAMMEAGIHCAEPVACVERTAFRPQGYLLVREIPQATLLCPFLAEARARAGSRERHRFAAHLGREIARLHSAGINHPDLMSKHILVRPSAEPAGPPDIWFIDMQRSSTKAVLSFRQRVHDLASLDATVHPRLAGDADRLALLHSYISAAEWTTDVRALVSAIRKRGAALLRRSRFHALRNAAVDASCT